MLPGACAELERVGQHRDEYVEALANGLGIARQIDDERRAALAGNPKAVRECLGVLVPMLPHALKLSAGGGQH